MIAYPAAASDGAVCADAGPRSPANSDEQPGNDRSPLNTGVLGRTHENAPSATEIAARVREAFAVLGV